MTGEGFGPWGPKQYLLNLELIAKVASFVGAELVLCNQAHLAIKNGAGSGQERGEKYASTILKLPHEETMRAFDAVYQSVDKVAENRGSLVVDMNEALSGRSEYFRDGIHFSLAGSQAAAALVTTAIEPLVAHTLARRSLSSK